MGKFFNKQLEEDKKGLLKRLKNIEDKSEKQLKEIKNQRIKEFNDKDSRQLSLKALWFMTTSTVFTNKN